MRAPDPSTAVAAGQATEGPENWRRILEELRTSHGPEIVTSWFERIEFEGMMQGVVYLSTPTRFIRHWTQGKYGNEILQRWRALDARVVDLCFQVRELRSPDEEADAAPSEAPAQSGRPALTAPAPHRQSDGPAPAPSGPGLTGSPLEARFTFDTLVEGPPNALAVAVARQVAFARPGDRIGFNPLFVAAAVGLGKTHLCQAVAAAACATDPSRRVLYLTAEHFMYRFVSAIRNRNTLSFKDILRDIDILIVDDLQFLNGSKVHEEFGHTLTTLMDGGRQVVVAADRAPADLEGLEARVASRLGGGLLVSLEAPDYAMRRAILERRIAVQREVFGHLDFPDEVVDFIARSVTTNGRDLDGAVNRLVANNQLTGAPIDLKIAETALRDLLRARETRRPRIEDIQRVTCQHYGVTRQDLLSARRNRVIVLPRQVAMYLCKMLTPRSLPEIGRRFGDRDHTTVLHAVRKVEKLLDSDTQVAEDVETLKRLLDQ